jgi:hypothetical protein
MSQLLSGIGGYAAMRKKSNLLPKPPIRMWSKRPTHGRDSKPKKTKYVQTYIEPPHWINDAVTVAQARQGMLRPHSKGNAACTRCLSDYPRPCPCGGLIHAHLHYGCSSEFGDSCDFETMCDKCGIFTAETRYELRKRPLDLSQILA